MGSAGPRHVRRCIAAAAADAAIRFSSTRQRAQTHLKTLCAHNLENQRTFQELR